MIDTTRWLKAKEVAEMITYSEDTLRRWRNEGYGPPWTRMKGDHGRGEIRYPESGVEEFMREGLGNSRAEELAQLELTDEGENSDG